MNTTANRRIRAIVNGKAAADPGLRSAIGQLRDEGVTIEVRVTWEGGDAARYAAEAARDEVDVVAACGGDGTVNEVVNGVLQETESPQTALGVVPYGTANDFATACGIPARDPLQAFRLLATEAPRKIDVGKVNDRYFINVVSGGFGAEVTARTPAEMKRVLGGAAYTLMGVVTAAKMSPYRATFTAAEGTAAEGTETADILVITVANGRQCGGGIQVAPHALLDDGALDILVVRDVALGDFGSLLSELANLQLGKGNCVAHVRQPAFALETDSPLQMNLDGEPIRDTRFRFETLTRRLPFVLPATAPLDQNPHDAPSG